MHAILTKKASGDPLEDLGRRIRWSLSWEHESRSEFAELELSLLRELRKAEQR